MTIALRALLVVAWSAFVAGAIWKATAKDLERHEETTTQRIALAADGSAELERPITGSHRLFFGATVGGESDALAVEQFIASRPMLRIRASFLDSQDVVSVVIFKGESFALLPEVSGVDTWFFVEGRLDLETKTATRCTVELEGDKGFLGDRPIFLQIGLKTEKIGGAWTASLLDREVYWRGLLLLAGSAGIFCHVFFILARLAVPWRQDAPPPDDSLPA